MMIKRFLAGCVTLATVLPATLVAQTVIYEATFPTAADASTFDADWYGHRLSTGDWVNSLSSNLGGVYPQTAYILGSGGSAPSDTGTGYLFFSSSGNAPFLMWTDMVDVNPADYTGLTVDFQLRNNSAGNTLRVAVQIGGSWYGSDSTYNDPDGNGTWNAQSMAYTTAGSGWRAITFDGGPMTSSTVGLAIDGATLGSDLPVGNITGLGFYSDASDSFMRIDHVVLSGTPVPEPGTFAMLTGLLVLGYICIRRRK